MPTIGVALAIPEPWATQLQDYRTAVGDTTATMIPTHITLVPPTEVDDDDLAGDRDAPRRRSPAGSRGFGVHLRGTGTFRPVSPVVFVTLVEGISQCEQLADAVRRGPLDVDAAVPVPPARDDRPPPARRRARPGVRGAGRLRVRLRRPTSSTSTSTTTRPAGSRRRDFPLQPRRCADVPSLKERLAPRSRPRRDARSSTTWCGCRSTTATSRAASRPARSPTSRSCRSSRSWRSRSSSSAGVAQVYPDAERRPHRRHQRRCCPGLIGDRRGPDLARRHRAGGRRRSGSSALLGLLYAGLGWLSAMRDALIVVFELPGAEQPNFVVGKLRDLVTLALIGVDAGAERRGRRVRQRLRRATCSTGSGSASELAPAGRAAHRACSASPPTCCCSSSCSGCWPSPHTPAPLAVVRGAARRGRLRGAQAAVVPAARVHPGPPAFQAFGIALILLVWINYFSRVVMYAAAWAHTSRRGPGAARARGARRRPDRGPAWRSSPRSPLRRAGRSRSRLSPGRAVRGRRGHHARPGRRAPRRTEGAVMRFERKHAVLLLGGRRLERPHLRHVRPQPAARRTPSGEDRATGYWVAHSVLIVVNFVIAAVLGRLGWKALRSSADGTSAYGPPTTLTPSRRAPGSAPP